MYKVEKISAGYAVVNWKDEIEVCYKNRKFAEQYCQGSIISIMGEAENYDMRRDSVLKYLESRKGRAPKVISQMELF